MLVMALGLGLDLWSKTYAFAHVADEPVVIDREVVLADPQWAPPMHAPVHLLPWNLLDARLVANHGAVFGIGNGKRIFFIGFTLVALFGGLMMFALWTSPTNHAAHIGIGLVLAGGLGNLYDRIVYGIVRDFLHMLPDIRLPFGWHWWGNNPEVFPWVFNVADMLLLGGIALLFVQLNRKTGKEEERAKNDAGMHEQAT